MSERLQPRLSITWPDLGLLLARVGVGVLWCVAVPLLFLLLYATLALQAESRKLTGIGGMPAVAIAAHSEKLARIDAKADEAWRAYRYWHDQYDRDDKAYTGAKNALLQTLMQIAADDPQAPNFATCHASRDDVIACHDQVFAVAQRRLTKLAPDQRQELRLLLDRTASEFATFLDRGADTQQELARMAETQKLRDQLLAQDAQLRGPAGDRIQAMTDTYDELAAKLPGFKTFFLVPDGAAVAFFTGVMGAVGAAVFSLYKRLSPHTQRAQEPLARSYVTRPLLGALAGFMVYFVMSAGAAFITQPAGDVSSAINSLSPAALATLGLFAGIAAENALRWLASKAAGLFKLDAPPARPRGAAQAGNGGRPA